LLLKIGLEQLGKNFYEVSVSERVRAAREFARRPKPGDGWWFLVRSSPAEYLTGSTQIFESSIEIIETGGVLVSAMHMLGVSTMVSLEYGELPAEKGDLPEPEYRIIFAKC